MRITLLYFAALRECSGKDREERVLPSSVNDVATLVAYLNELPELCGKLSSTRVAVNEEFADIDQRLEDGDVVALIPPVQGG